MASISKATDSAPRLVPYRSSFHGSFSASPDEVAAAVLGLAVLALSLIHFAVELTTAVTRFAPQRSRSAGSRTCESQGFVRYYREIIPPSGHSWEPQYWTLRPMSRCNVAVREDTKLQSDQNIPDKSTSPQSVAVPLPIAYGVYAIVDGRLTELEPRPIKAIGHGTATSGIISTEAKPNCQMVGFSSSSSSASW